MNPSEKCPFCGCLSVVSGRTLGDAYGTYFEPEEIRVSRWRKATAIGTSVQLKEPASACFKCGKVWGDLEPVELHYLLHKVGTAEVKARLESKPSA